MKKNSSRFCLYAFLLLAVSFSKAQSILPPVIDWHGKSESLIAKASDPWITTAEKTNFNSTPGYAETMDWLKKLTYASPFLKMVSIGKTVEGRTIYMIIASTEKIKTAVSLQKSGKPLFLAQAGIHSGEIDGKDAGMMLLRDIAMGNKKSLIDKVNFLFIPILNADGHERSSPYNRPNQRGPQNMGWRTNAQNLNLNRDYAKLDTREIRSVINVINEYNPSLYMDIHVTDGADYQYDITFGGLGKQGYSVNIGDWLENQFKPFVDKSLQDKGHIPGPLLNAFNERDFSEGNIIVTGGPRFSDSYGDLRHMPSILVENHSLKPYKQRVLGTYVLLESTLQFLAIQGKTIRKLTDMDKSFRSDSLPMEWKVPQMKNRISIDSKTSEQNNLAPAPDSIRFLGIASTLQQSSVTHSGYVEWQGKPVSMNIANYLSTEAFQFVKRPKGYWVPAACEEVINRLALHGIQMTTIAQPREEKVSMYRINEYQFGNENGEAKPFEGRMQVNATTTAEMHTQLFPAGSVFISTDQPLGDLAMLLLEPSSKDSYFSWGFFNAVFQRTEYMEAYVIQPMAKKMLEDSPALQKEFEEKKAKDAKFANDPFAILTWFYSKTKYYDERYLLYPVGRAM